MRRQKKEKKEMKEEKETESRGRSKKEKKEMMYVNNSHVVMQQKRKGPIGLSHVHNGIVPL